MRLIVQRTLLDFIATREGRGDHDAVKAAIEAWFHEVRRAAWRSPSELKRHYAAASLVGADRVAFNIKGNSYRLVVAIDYEKGIVWIKWIGTHSAYDKIDVRTIEHERSSYD